MSAAIEVIDESSLVEPPEAFLEVRDLKVHFPTEDGLVKAVDGLAF
jgi:peptide/nickel transport system ATP-binding protein